MVQIEFTPNTRGEMAHGEAASPRRRTLAGSIDAVLGTLVEIPAAILVVAEIVILFAGVVSRYVMHSPLIWSDELASILFLWLAMFGAVVAFRRAEHMRMTAVVAAARPAMRAYLDVVATCAALAFLLLVIWPAYDYAYEESFNGGVCQFWEKVVGRRKSHRSEYKPHEVMYIEPAHINLGDSIRNKVDSITPHEISKGRPYERSHGVPKGDIHFLVLACEDRHEDVDTN